MFAKFFREALSAVAERFVLDKESDPDDFCYPPRMKGLPPTPPDEILKSFSKNLYQLFNSTDLNNEDHKRFYTDTIERFAAFAHLLPASQTHHHRGTAGLLAHSLDVGIWSLQHANKLILAQDKPPRERLQILPRWQLTAYLAGLCHDAGKPLSDYAVTNKDRTKTWKPLEESLYEWLQRNKIKAYYIDWREGRAKEHIPLTPSIANKIISADTIKWIGEGGMDLVIWLNESLSGNPGPTNLIYDMVVKSDQMSVERDLKKIGESATTQGAVGIPVEQNLFNVMKRLVQEGVWLVNEPGARVWNIEGNIYLIWPLAGEELARQIVGDKIAGLPISPDGILSMLKERGFAFLTDGGELWQIAPACVSEKIPTIKLSAIRLRDAAIVSFVPIPSIDGVIINAQLNTKSTVQPAVNSEADDTTSTRQETASVRVFGAEQYTKPEVSKTPAQTKAQAPKDHNQSKPPAQHAEKSEKSNKPPRVALEGAVGEALKALIQDVKSNEKQWDGDIRVDEEGYLLVRWPDAFSGYGLTTKTILEELTSREWVWTDPMAPLRKAFDSQMAGNTVKVIRLDREVSDTLIDMLGKIPTKPNAKPVEVQQSVEPSAVQAVPVEADHHGEEPPVEESMSQEQKDPEVAAKFNPQELLEAVIKVILGINLTPKDGWVSAKTHKVVAAAKDNGLDVTYAQLMSIRHAATDRFSVGKFSVKVKV